MTRYTYIHDESDAQGPNVLLCEDCIRADRHEVEDWAGDLAEDGVRCACCGATGEYRLSEEQRDTLAMYAGLVQ